MPAPSPAPPSSASPASLDGAAAINRYAAVDEEDHGTEDVVVVVAGIEGLVSILSGGTTSTAAMRLSLVAHRCIVGLPEGRRLSRTMHPTGIMLNGSEVAGAVLGNVALLAGFALLCLSAHQIVSFVGRVVKPDYFEKADVQGMLRLPSAPLFVFNVLFQGTSLAAMWMMMEWQGVVAVLVAGAVVLSVCVVVPFAIMKRLVAFVPDKATYYVVAPQRRMVEFCLGPGEWANASEGKMWVQRYSCVMLCFAQSTVWFGVLELVASFAVSAMHATFPQSHIGCGHMRVSQSLVFLTLGALEGCLAPHARQRDVATFVLLYAVQAFAMLLEAAGHYLEDTDHIVYRAGGKLLLVCAVLLALKLVADVVSELYILVTGRRSGAQADLLAANELSLLENEAAEEYSYSELGVLGDTQPAGSGMLTPRSVSIGNAEGEVLGAYTMPVFLSTPNSLHAVSPRNGASPLSPKVRSNSTANSAANTSFAESVLGRSSQAYTPKGRAAGRVRSSLSESPRRRNTGGSDMSLVNLGRASANGSLGSNPGGEYALSV